MLSYRHAFHAGNFADVLKHVVLMRILDYLTQKDTPLLYLDTHAGAGEYDLRSPEAQKTGEYRGGIGALWKENALCGPLRTYVDFVRTLNADGKLRRLPGSPRIAQRLLRPQDRLLLCELHPGDFRLLDQVFSRDRRVRCRMEDGFDVAIASLPPRERRGVVFIDPSYELEDDYGTAPVRLTRMYRRFATGIYALWYPLVDRRLAAALKSAIRECGIRDVLNLEIVIEPEPGRAGLRGCGMLVVNPPWTLKSEIDPALQQLAQHCAGPRPGRVALDQLVPE